MVISPHRPLRGTIPQLKHGFMPCYITGQGAPPNWSALVRALRSTVIGRGVVARRVETILVSVDVHTCSW